MYDLFRFCLLKLIIRQATDYWYASCPFLEQRKYNFTRLTETGFLKEKLIGEI